MTELKPCPFCGMYPIFRQNSLSHPLNPACILASSNGIAWVLPDVVKLWNSRAPSKDRQLLEFISKMTFVVGTEQETLVAFFKKIQKHLEENP